MFKIGISSMLGPPDPSLDEIECQAMPGCEFAAAPKHDFKSSGGYQNALSLIRSTERGPVTSLRDRARETPRLLPLVFSVLARH
jgi:hypothetical protein